MKSLHLYSQDLSWLWSYGSVAGYAFRKRIRWELRGRGSGVARDTIDRVQTQWLAL